MRLIYVGNFNSDGVSSLINVGSAGSNIKKVISNSTLNEINSKFPERKLLFNEHPEWIKDNNLILLDSSEIKVSFVDEGAGYRNSFGYYIYDTIDPPSYVSDIEDVFIIFPNASKYGKGGYLLTGDTMQLPYEVETSTVNNVLIGTPTNYTFPGGKSVGFVIYANGWTGNNVNKNVDRYFTNSTFNPERADWLKRHTALVKLDNQNLLIMGLEDLRRDRGYCDHDFNDLLVIVDTDLSNLSEESYNKETEDLNDPPIEYKVGYKKAFIDVVEDSVNKITECIVTLYIPPTSTIVRHNYSGKLRTSRAYVASISGSKPFYNKWNTAAGNYIGHSFTQAHSSNNPSFIYYKNDWVTSNLNEDPEINSEGIHYFSTYDQAVEYVFEY